MSNSWIVKTQFDSNHVRIYRPINYFELVLENEFIIDSKLIADMMVIQGDNILLVAENGSFLYNKYGFCQYILPNTWLSFAIVDEKIGEFTKIVTSNKRDNNLLLWIVPYFESKRNIEPEILKSKNIYVGHSHDVNAISPLPNGNFVSISCMEVIIWDTEESEVISIVRFNKWPKEQRKIIPLPNNDFIVNYNNHSFEVWNYNTMEYITIVSNFIDKIKHDVPYRTGQVIKLDGTISNFNIYPLPDGKIITGYCPGSRIVIYK